MRIHKIGHSSVVVNVGETNVLTDPGSFTSADALAAVSDLSAVVITHKHGDHLEEGRLRTVLDNNASAEVYTNAETGAELDSMNIKWHEITDGSETVIGEIAIKAWEVDHHPIHERVPVVRNLALLFNDTFLHPGDALFVPPVSAKVLAMPFGPFASIGECLDYGLAVSPERIIPLHDGYMDTRNPYASVPNWVWKEADFSYEYLRAGESIEV